MLSWALGDAPHRGRWIGAVSGVLLAHAMFDLTLLQMSATVRTGPGQWLSEMVATLVLLTIILRALHSELAAGVRLAYLDPPYNIGVASDHYADRQTQPGACPFATPHQG
jgi:glycerol uptake facilitator-like aquaporin